MNSIKINKKSKKARKKQQQKNRQALIPKRGHFQLVLFPLPLISSSVDRYLGRFHLVSKLMFAQQGVKDLKELFSIQLLKYNCLFLFWQIVLMVFKSGSCFCVSRFFFFFCFFLSPSSLFKSNTQRAFKMSYLTFCVILQGFRFVQNSSVSLRYFQQEFCKESGCFFPPKGNKQLIQSTTLYITIFTHLYMHTYTL